MHHPDLWSEEQREYDLLLQGATHDLRSAFGKVKTLAQLLARQSPPDPATLEHLNETMNRGDTLFRDLSAWRNAGLPVSSPRTECTLQLLVDGARFQLRNRNLVINVSQDAPLVPGHPAALEEMFLRLFDNAAKFGATHINITGIRDEEEVHLKVTDDGPGIPNEYQEQVWWPFERLHGSNIPGNGLGLSICRRLVRREGGKIWSEAGEPNGTVVHIRLPGVNSVPA